jgi:hypothetical protein
LEKPGERLGFFLLSPTERDKRLVRAFRQDRGRYPTHGKKRATGERGRKTRQSARMTASGKRSKPSRTFPPITPKLMACFIAPKERNYNRGRGKPGERLPGERLEELEMLKLELTGTRDYEILMEVLSDAIEEGRREMGNSRMRLSRRWELEAWLKDADDLFCRLLDMTEIAE